MNTYERPHVARLVRMLENDDAMRIVAITGPRQTGKTDRRPPGAPAAGGVRATVLVRPA